MIVTTLKDYKSLEALNPNIVKAIDFACSHNWNDAPTGRHEVDGDNIYINHQVIDAVAREKQVLEIHRRYIDVHILLKGNETIGWKALADIQHISKQYDAEGDYELSDDRPTAFVDLLPGQVLVAFPEDPHAPIIGEGKIDKLICKIRI